MQKMPALTPILSKLTVNCPVVKTGRRRLLHTTTNASFEGHEQPAAHLEAILRSNGKDLAIIAYNKSDTDASLELVALNKRFDHIHKMKTLYGYESSSMVDVIHKKQGKRQHNFIQLYMRPKQLVILASCHQ